MAATLEVTHATDISARIVQIGGMPASVGIAAISRDGSVIVGTFKNNAGSNDRKMFRYTEAGGMENLGTLGQANINPTCLSSDGSIVAGTFYVEGEGSHMFRYSREGGLQDLGTAGRNYVSVNAISGDGSTLLGHFMLPQEPETTARYRAFQYSQAGGFVDLGNMGAESAFVRGIAEDGSSIVGNFHAVDSEHFGFKFTSEHAYRYSARGGLQDFGSIGDGAAFATAVSNDGSVVAGTYFGDFSFYHYTYYTYIFIYTKADGVQKLDAMGGQSAQVHALSADGSTLVGSYVDSRHYSHAFVARVVNAPGSAPRPR